MPWAARLVCSHSADAEGRIRASMHLMMNSDPSCVWICIMCRMLRHGRSKANEAGLIVSTLVSPSVITPSYVAASQHLCCSTAILLCPACLQENGVLEKWGLAPAGEKSASAAGCGADKISMLSHQATTSGHYIRPTAKFEKSSSDLLSSSCILLCTPGRSSLPS